MRYRNRYESRNTPQPWYITVIAIAAFVLWTMLQRLPNGSLFIANPLAPACKPGSTGCVWVNPRSNVYHYPNTEYYGLTRRGFYMKEQDAKAAGFRGVRN